MRTSLCANHKQPQKPELSVEGVFQKKMIWIICQISSKTCMMETILTCIATPRKFMRVPYYRSTALF